MGSTWQSGTAINSNSFTFDISEGDWGAYQLYRNRAGADEIMKRSDGRNSYLRQCALAYLGKRAQLYGGTCSKMHARIFTPSFVAELCVANKDKRFNRYPWLEKLINLVAEIEREQEKAANSDNVISLIGATK